MITYRDMHGRSVQGYSIVEVLIAIAILLIAIVGPLSIASTGLKNASSAKVRTQAFFLAQESVEWVMHWREDVALEALVDSNVDTWSWVNDHIPAQCQSNVACGVDVFSDSVFLCSNPGAGKSCAVYQHETGRTRLRHQTGGSETPFTREVFFTTGTGYITVRSVVSWGPDADDQVTLETILFDIHR